MYYRNAKRLDYDIFVRLNKEEKQLAKSYAKHHSITLTEAFKRSLFEKIEDEYDIRAALEAHKEYLENPKTYTHEEARKLLDL